LNWSRGDGPLAGVVLEQTGACLAVYREDPSRIAQDANNELRIAEGGYRGRQLYELLQNAVDAARGGGGRVEVRLTKTHLYVANDGEPFTEEGVRALMASDLSPKDDERIGRFGIGFKSVLAVTAEPKVFSRSVSFAFDAAAAEAVIRGAGFVAPRYPMTRLATVIDPVAAGDADPVLQELMTWASTVVVLPVRARRRELAADVRAFPAHFLLFSDHVHSLRLVDMEAEAGILDRSVALERGPAGLSTVVEGARREEWRVFRSSWRPSKEALRDAGRLAGRDVVDLAWAVPRRPRPGIGVFWAYFPTDALTTLSGIVNAPWQLGDDRRTLLEGEFNRELLTKALPTLVARNVGALHDPTNPGLVLDVYPARGDEWRSWADRVLNTPVIEALQKTASLPDCSGRAAPPSGLRLLAEGLRQEWIDEWIGSGFAPLDEWAHPATVSSAERRAKARRLVGPETEGPSEITEWLEALVRSGSTDASGAAIMLAAHMVRAVPDNAEIQAAIRGARVLRLEDGSFARPVRGKIFVRASEDDSGQVFVDDDLAHRPGVADALQTLGIALHDKRGELQHLLVNAAGTDAGWQRIWTLMKDLPAEFAKEVFDAELPRPFETRVRVRTAAGTWKALAEVFLPGTIIPADGSRDREFLVDPRIHADDVDFLRELGAVSEPAWRDEAPVEHWRAPYEQAMKDHFISQASGSAPRAENLAVTGSATLWPLDLIEHLSPDGRLAMTNAILGRGLVKPWTVRHTTVASYGRTSVIAPEIWMVHKHGLVDTCFGPLRPRRTVLPGDGVSEDVLPVARGLSEKNATKIGVRADVDGLTDADWSFLKPIADGWEDDDRRAEFYAWFSWKSERAVPEELVVRVGPRRRAVKRENVGATSELAEYEALLEAQVPALYLGTDEDAAHMIETWGLARGSDLLRQELVAEETGEPVFLTEEFPPLAFNPNLAPDDRDITLVRCSRLVRLLATPEGQVPRNIAVHRERDRVLVTASSPAEILRQVSGALKLDLDERGIARVLEQMAESAQSDHRKRIRAAAAESPEDALVEAVGIENLRRQVPRQALDALGEGDLLPRDLARLVLAVHGIGVLKAFRSVLEEQRLDPPREFSGRQKERRWVAELGLPQEWAGFATRSAPAREVIDGPVSLDPLHDYQEVVTERIRALLGGSGPERGVVSLPTGAGKTRVTIQALVEEIAAGRLSGPVLWIAQSEELCEQAAQSWAYVWRAIGPAHALTLSRLWGSKDAEEEPEGTQVVIAIDAKLDSILSRDDERYEWLREPSVVVVDEAHTSVSPRYTRLLEWLGRGGRTRTGRFLLGLTATPYRGTSDEETKRLVRRYDSNLLDRDVLGDKPYLELQKLCVLAQIDRRTVAGARVEFTDDEIREIADNNKFPSRTEEDLGNDRERNERIVRSILDLPDDWTVLLFAPSVENARALAALLSYRGVPAVSISSGTETSARRHYIDQFREGRIRVLTNYGVLAQGFDAPRVRAVYVCRPTFSPNVYQQMVGRGLRGPRNGGSDRVLIVDVEDNLNHFGDRLAFRDFEKIWLS